MKLIQSAALAVMLGVTQTAHAQDTQWTTELDLPLGLNVPDGISFDVLGIAPGMTYDVVKAKLEELAAGRAQVQETITTFALAGNEFRSVEISFPSEMELRLYTEDNVEEIYRAWFSAPSSGHQMLLLSRNIYYKVPDREPRISEVLAAMTNKYGGEPVLKPFASYEWTWRYADGAYIPQETGMGDCSGIISRYEGPANAASINDRGVCDLLVTIRASGGISDDHASNIVIHLSDYERARQNMVTDYEFFDTYLDRIRDNTAGEAPKL
jgi:hypothetical protein